MVCPETELHTIEDLAFFKNFRLSCIAFSKTLLKIESKDFGLLFETNEESSFIKIGIICAILSLWGKILDSND